MSKFEGSFQFLIECDFVGYRLYLPKMVLAEMHVLYMLGLLRIVIVE